MRSLQQRVAVDAPVAIALIIGEDEKDVRLRRFGGVGRDYRRPEGKDADDGEEKRGRFCHHGLGWLVIFIFGMPFWKDKIRI
jgi:hypothetical protein